METQTQTEKHQSPRPSDYPVGSTFTRVGGSYLVVGPVEADPYFRRLWLHPTPRKYPAAMAQPLSVVASKNRVTFYEGGERLETGPDWLIGAKNRVMMARAMKIGRNRVLRALYWPVSKMRWVGVERRQRKADVHWRALREKEGEPKELEQLEETVAAIEPYYPEGCTFVKLGRSFLVIGPGVVGESSRSRNIWIQPAPSMYHPVHRNRGEHAIVISEEFEGDELTLTQQGLPYETRTSFLLAAQNGQRRRILVRMNHLAMPEHTGRVSALRWWWNVRRLARQVSGQRAKLTHVEDCILTW